MKTKSNIIITVCRFCGVIMGVQDAQGSKGGPSHSECDVCHPLFIDKEKLQQKLRKLSSGKLLSNAKAIEEISRKIEMINRILSFRKYAVELKVRGPAIRLTMEG